MFEPNGAKLQTQKRETRQRTKLEELLLVEMYMKPRSLPLLGLIVHIVIPPHD